MRSLLALLLACLTLPAAEIDYRALDPTWFLTNGLIVSLNTTSLASYVSGNAGTGTVTSVAISGPAGFTWSSAVTGSGTLTATTPGLVLTNGESISISLSNRVNIEGTAQVLQTDYRTNSGTQAPDFTKGYQLFSTNAAFTFLAPIGVDTTKLQAQTAVVVVTNSTAAAVLVSPPASVFQQGTWYVTNVTTFTFFTYASMFTNGYAIPLY